MYLSAARLPHSAVGHDLLRRLFPPQLKLSQDLLIPRDLPFFPKMPGLVLPPPPQMDAVTHVRSTAFLFHQPIKGHLGLLHLILCSCFLCSKVSHRSNSSHMVFAQNTLKDSSSKPSKVCRASGPTLASVTILHCSCILAAFSPRFLLFLVMGCIQYAKSYSHYCPKQRSSFLSTNLYLLSKMNTHSPKSPGAFLFVSSVAHLSLASN